MAAEKTFLYAGLKERLDQGLARADPQQRSAYEWGFLGAVHGLGTGLTGPYSSLGEMLADFGRWYAAQKEQAPAPEPAPVLLGSALVID